MPTAMEIPLRSTSGYILPDTRWPKTAEVVNKDTAFAVAKKKRYSHRQEQGNSWDQYEDSSSAASAPASTEEGGRYGIRGARGLPTLWVAVRCRLPQSMMYSQPTEEIILVHIEIATSGLRSHRMKIPRRALQACLPRSGDLNFEQIRTCQALLATPLKGALRGWNALMSLCNLMTKL